MPDLKEKPEAGKPKKRRNQRAIPPKQAIRMMKEKYLHELEQRQETADTEPTYATDRVEEAGRWAVNKLTDAAPCCLERQQKPQGKETLPDEPPPGKKPPPSQESASGADMPPERPEHPANAPREREVVEYRTSPVREHSPTPKERAAVPADAINAPKERTPAAPKAREAPLPLQHESAPRERAARPVLLPEEAGRPPKYSSERPLERAVKGPKTRPDDTPRAPIHAHAPTTAPKKSPATSHPAKAGEPPAYTALNNSRRGPAAHHQLPFGTSRRSAHSATPARGNAPPIRNNPGERHAITPRTRPGPVKLRGDIPANSRTSSFKPRPSLTRKPAAPAVRKTQQTLRQHMTQQIVSQAKKVAKTSATAAKHVTVAVAKAASSLIGAIVGIAGGGILLVALVVVIVIAAVASSPFGLFFTDEQNAPGTVSVSEAVSAVNLAFNERLEALQAGDYDSIEIEGQAADWADVLAVFAVKLAGADVDGADVATLDADRVEKLTEIFWAMTAITSRVEVIDHPASGSEPAWTEYILHITITAKTADDMRTLYGFSDYQNSALDELLSDRATLSALAGSLAITNADVKAVLDALPDDISPERRAVVKNALGLVGKVGYFWGGKSSAIGWDSRWRQLTKVTAPGNSTTGTYRPFGLDCTGLIDWSLRNAGLPSDGNWYIGVNLTEVSYADALPGDIALFPDASHVGLVVGRTETGGLLVCHCSSGRNLVIVTDCAATGFTDIGRPGIYEL